jgi:hypothetical protein
VVEIAKGGGGYHEREGLGKGQQRTASANGPHSCSSGPVVTLILLLIIYILFCIFLLIVSDVSNYDWY